MRKNTFTLVSLLVLSALAQCLGQYQLGYVLLPVFVASIMVLAFLSPAVVGSFLLFGWVVLPAMDSIPVGFVPRLPATSIVALAALVGLAAARVSSRFGRSLLRPTVGFYVSLFLLVFFLGYLGILRAGKWNNLMIQTLAWQKFISCASMFGCGILCCRNRRDFELILRMFPIWFVIYIIYIPPEVYLHFLRDLLAGDSSYSVGLAYETLNTNTLGQGACLTAVVSYVLLARSSAPIRSRVFYLAIFLVAVAMTLASASRQGLLALIVGLWLAFTFKRPLIGCIVAIGALATVSGAIAKLSTITVGQSYIARITDLAKAGDEWSTVSLSARQGEITSALPHLWERPLLGFGFGGYSLAHDLPDIASRSELNSSDILTQLWTEGYPLVGEHNFPIALYLQTGLVGTMAFLLLVTGPYLWMRRQDRQMSIHNQVDSDSDLRVAVLSLWVTIFVLQNISGGFALGSMSTLLFLTGALIAGCAGSARMLKMEKVRSGMFTHAAAHP